jgi:hypothetical protein
VCRACLSSSHDTPATSRGRARARAGRGFGPRRQGVVDHGAACSIVMGQCGGTTRHASLRPHYRDQVQRVLLSYAGLLNHARAPACECQVRQSARERQNRIEGGVRGNTHTHTFARARSRQAREKEESKGMRSRFLHRAGAQGARGRAGAAANVHAFLLYPQHPTAQAHPRVARGSPREERALGLLGSD